MSDLPVAPFIKAVVPGFRKTVQTRQSDHSATVLHAFIYIAGISP